MGRLSSLRELCSGHCQLSLLLISIRPILTNTERHSCDNGNPSLPWSIVQEPLFRAQGDVLLHWESCNGCLITPRVREGIKFELLGAECSRRQEGSQCRTGMSFTGALIEKLKDVKKGGQDEVYGYLLAEGLRKDIYLYDYPVRELIHNCV